VAVVASGRQPLAGEVELSSGSRGCRRLLAGDVRGIVDRLLAEQLLMAAGTATLERLDAAVVQHHVCVLEALLEYNVRGRTHR
jgi:hypothetical protein